MSEHRIVLVDGARTPVGKYGGVLKSLPAHELGAMAAATAIQQSGIAPSDVHEVIMGCIGQVGPETPTMRAGLPSRPDSTPAFTVNRLCDSGLQAIWSAAQQLQWDGC
jgi:acetyl-CoA C-acetyltransferase